MGQIGAWLYLLLKWVENITYIYDATGAKLKKIATEGSSLITEYAGNYVYKNGVLEFFNTSEGYVEKEADGFKYTYQYHDHLGNIRLSYSDRDKDGKIDVVRNNTDVDGDNDNLHEIIQIQDYYPFGLEIEYGADHPNSLITGSNEHPYKFLGKEYTESLNLNMYEMDWRQYDPALGRFNVIDALAGSFVENTPYHYGYNNPISFIDPTGLFSTHTDESGNIIKEYDDGDDGVYVHNTGTTETEIDKQREDKKNTGGTGEHIGEIGGVIKADRIYANALATNIAEAEGIYNPFTFRNNVKNEGKWDLKNNKNTIFGLANDGETQFSFEGELFESQDIGNHNFGAVGKAANLFSEDFMLERAGVAQVAGGTSKPEWQKFKTVKTVNYTKTGRAIFGTKQVSIPPYGDDPRDQKFIKKGFEYYDKKK